MRRLPEETYLNIAEQMEARCTAEGEYYIWNRKEDLYYYFTKEKYKEQQLLSRIVDNNDFSIDFFYNGSGQLEKYLYVILVKKNIQERRFLIM